MPKLFKIFCTCMIAFFLCSTVSYGETVKIFAEDDWYPYSAKGENGAHGIGVDIVRAAFNAEGVEVDFQVINYDRGMADVKEGKAIGCFDAPRTKEIEDLYLWHEQPMFSATSSFFAAADFEGQIDSLDHLTGKTLGLTQGYGYGDALDTNKDLNKEYSSSDEILIKKLIGKRVDVIVLFDKIADYMVPKMGVQGQIKAVGRAEAPQIYVAFSKANPDGEKYRDIFSKGFRKIKEDGTYEKIMADWEVKLKATTADTAE